MIIEYANGDNVSVEDMIRTLRDSVQKAMEETGGDSIEIDDQNGKYEKDLTIGKKSDVHIVLTGNDIKFYNQEEELASLSKTKFKADYGEFAGFEFTKDTTGQGYDILKKECVAKDGCTYSIVLCAGNDAWADYGGQGKTKVIQIRKKMPGSSNFSNVMYVTADGDVNSRMNSCNSLSVRDKMYVNNEEIITRSNELYEFANPDTDWKIIEWSDGSVDAYAKTEVTTSYGNNSLAREYRVDDIEDIYGNLLMSIRMFESVEYSVELPFDLMNKKDELHVHVTPVLLGQDYEYRSSEWLGHVTVGDSVVGFKFISFSRLRRGVWSVNIHCHLPAQEEEEEEEGN